MPSKYGHLNVKMGQRLYLGTQIVTPSPTVTPGQALLCDLYLEYAGDHPGEGFHLAWKRATPLGWARYVKRIPYDASLVGANATALVPLILSEEERNSYAVHP